MRMTWRSDCSSNSPQGRSHSFHSPREEASSSLPERTHSVVVAAERFQTWPIRCQRWKAQANERIAQHLGIENKPIRGQAVSGPTVGLVGPKPASGPLRRAEGIGAPEALSCPGTRGLCVVIWAGQRPRGCTQALLCSQTGTDVPSPRGSSCFSVRPRSGPPPQGGTGDGDSDSRAAPEVPHHSPARSEPAQPAFSGRRLLTHMWSLPGLGRHVSRDLGRALPVPHPPTPFSRQFPS